MAAWTCFFISLLITRVFKILFPLNMSTSTKYGTIWGAFKDCDGLGFNLLFEVVKYIITLITQPRR